MCLQLCYISSVFIFHVNHYWSDCDTLLYWIKKKKWQLEECSSVTSELMHIALLRLSFFHLSCMCWCFTGRSAASLLGGSVLTLPLLWFQAFMLTSISSWYIFLKISFILMVSSLQVSLLALLIHAVKWFDIFLSLNKIHSQFFLKFVKNFWMWKAHCMLMTCSLQRTEWLMTEISCFGLAVSLWKTAQILRQYWQSAICFNLNVTSATTQS